MANSVGTHSYNTTFGVDPAGGTTYVAVAEVTKITFPDIKVGSSEMTNLTSPSAAKEFRAALLDAGEASFSLNWAKVTYNTLFGQLRTNLMAFKITFPLVGAEVTASKLEFKGHITALGGEVPEDATIMCNVTVKVSGLPVFTSGS